MEDDAHVSEARARQAAALRRMNRAMAAAVVTIALGAQAATPGPTDPGASSGGGGATSAQVDDDGAAV
jgi:hypothetical protein